MAGMMRATTRSSVYGSSVSERCTRRLVIATNIPTPYRVAFFEVLSKVLAEQRIDFHVLYFAITEPERHWKIDLSSQPYPFTVLPGLHAHIGEVNCHVNPTLPAILRRLNPAWTLVAGAWHMPSAIVAGSRQLSGYGYRLFWSEGHRDAVRNATGPIAYCRRLVLRGFDGYVVPNTTSEQFVKHDLKTTKPCIRLPNTVDENFFLEGPGVQRDELRRKLGLSETDLVLLCVARLVDRKGVFELAEAAKGLPTDIAGRVVLVFAGDGPLASKIASEESHGVRIRTLSHVTQTEVRDWLYATDLFILPSKYDPNPLSAIEAALCGVPMLLSSKAGNVRDLIPNADSGWILDNISASSIGDSLQSILRLPVEIRMTKGKEARARAIRDFSREGCARRFLDGILESFPLRAACA